MMAYRNKGNRRMNSFSTFGMLNLSIVIITYNRSAFLDRLLGRLASSPFRECSIWVLDNASTDETLQICTVWSSAFPHMRIVTHKFNIGADPNILRALEYGDDYYKWILCDDDELYFDGIDDLLDVLRNKKYDLIRVADLLVSAEERGICCTLDNLIHDKKSLFLSLAFVPGVIFRSSVVGPHVKDGYHHVHTRYQHLFVFLRSFDLCTQVYTTARPVVVYGTASTGTGIGSEIYLYWFRSLEALPTKKSRKIALGRIFRQFGLFGYGRSILSDIRAQRSKKTLWSIWKDVFLEVPTLKAKLIILLNLPFILIPFRVLVTVYPLLTGRPYVKRNFEEIKLSRE